MVRSGPVRSARSSLNHIRKRSCTLSTCTKAGSVLGFSRYDATERRDDITRAPSESLANVLGAVQLRRPPAIDHAGLTSLRLVPNSRVRGAERKRSIASPLPTSSVEGRGNRKSRCCAQGRGQSTHRAAVMRGIACLRHRPANSSLAGFSGRDASACSSAATSANQYGRLECRVTRGGFL